MCTQPSSIVACSSIGNPFWLKIALIDGAIQPRHFVTLHRFVFIPSFGVDLPVDHAIGPVEVSVGRELRKQVGALLVITNAAACLEL